VKKGEKHNDHTGEPRRKRKGPRICQAQTHVWGGKKGYKTRTLHTRKRKFWKSRGVLEKEKRKREMTRRVSEMLCPGERKTRAAKRGFVGEK